MDPLVFHPLTGRPIDWAGQFGRRARLEVEIGYGNGDFLVRRAQKHPDINFIALELVWSSTKRLLRRIARTGLSNIRALQLDADLAVDRLFAPCSVDRFYSLFPPPWPKEKHIKRRLFHQGFLQAVCNRLVPDGEFQIVTDHGPLCEWILEQVPGSGFKAAHELIPARFQTKYESKWRAGGQESFHEIILQKEWHPNTPPTEDTALRTYRFKDFNPEDIPLPDRMGNVTIKFRETLYDPRRRKALIRAYVIEGALQQNVWLEVVRDRDDAGWVLRLAQGNNIIPTEGIRQAMETVFQAVRS